jgi:hypothetical protein
MRFLTREIFGWALVLLGLFVFYKTYELLRDQTVSRFLEGSALTVVGFIIFRGGLHLLKVAVAAQVCLRAWEKVEGDARSTGLRTSAHRPNGFVPRPVAPGERPVLSASTQLPHRR